MKKTKVISEVFSKNGKYVSKTGEWKWVLIHEYRNLNKWSNKKENLEKQIKFLVKNGWIESELVIMNTIIKPI